MTRSKKPSDKKEEPDIAKFLLSDTESLRNEVRFTDLKDMVHPLTYNLFKHPNIRFIPVLDKSVIDTKKILLKLID